jgi:predicted nucleic acid-binding protein
MISFDSSTLILLAKIDLLKETRQDTKIIITDIFQKECTIKNTYDAKIISALIASNHIKVEKTVSKKEMNLIMKDFNINAGEASALWLAKNRKIPLATDDGPTIKACKVFNIPFLTAIHFLLDIFESGIISDREMALVKVERLAAYGRYNHRIIESAISRIKGEKP